MPRTPRYPIVTLGVMLLSVLGFLLVLEHGLAFDPFASHVERRWIYLNPWNVWSGGYWALLTDVFVHAADLPLIASAHLLLDLMGFWYFGRRVELALGSTALFAVLFFGALVSSGFGLLAGVGLGLGATGMICASIGLMIAARRRYFLFAELLLSPNQVRMMAGWLLLGLLGSLVGVIPISPVSLLGGWVFGYLAGHAFLYRRPRYVAMAGLALVILMTVMSVTWLPWLTEWRLWRFDEEMRAGHPRTASADIGPALALAEIEPLLRRSPPDPRVLNNVAWRLATSRHDSIRDGARATALARQACILTHWREPSVIDTLAAAYAESDCWREAEVFERAAIDTAVLAGASESEQAAFKENLNQILKRWKIRE